MRFLGIDAPEVAYDGNRAEPCGDEATALIENALTDTTAALTSDPEQPAQDRYGRTLAYVEVDGPDLSARLLETGIADLYRAAPTNSRYNDYQQIAASASAPDCRE